MLREPTHCGHPALCCGLNTNQENTNYIRPASLIWYYSGLRGEEYMLRASVSVVTKDKMLPSDRVHWFLNRTLKASRWKPASKFTHWSIVLQYLHFIYKPVYRYINWSWLCSMSLHLRTDKASSESELCSNKIDRLCLCPHGFTWLNHDLWSVNHTGSPMAHHSARPQTSRTGSPPPAPPVSQLSVISNDGFWSS